MQKLFSFLGGIIVIIGIIVGANLTLKNISLQKAPVSTKANALEATSVANQEP